MENNYFDNTDWLQSRLGRFTASEIHKLFTGGRKKDELFGQGAMTYIRTKAAEILTQEIKDEIDFKQAQWGKDHEHEAWELFEKTTGLKGEYYGAANPKFFEFGDFAGCSPDWDSVNMGGDFKCPFNSAEHLKNLCIKSADQLKDDRWEYYCQLQMSMIVRGWDHSYFVSYDPRFVYDHIKLKIVKVYPDQEWATDFNNRLKEATLLLSDMVTAFANPILVDYDADVKAMIISQ